MKNNIKKIGLFFLTILPGIISLIIQLAIGILLLIICVLMVTVKGGYTTDFNSLIIMDSALEIFYQKTGLMVFVYHILGIIGFGLWYYFGCGKPKMSNPLNSFPKGSILSVIITALGLCLFANAFIMVGCFVAPSAIEAFSTLMEAAGIGVDSFAIFASIILAPIGEEIVCRGLTFHYAKRMVADMKNRQVAFWIANILQAFMFGVMHGNLVQGIYAFILGLGLGWLREHYKSLYPAILAHGIINFSSTFLVSYPLSLLPETLTAALLFMIVSIGVTFLGIFLAISTNRTKS